MSSKSKMPTKKYSLIDKKSHRVYIKEHPQKKGNPGKKSTPWSKLKRRVSDLKEGEIEQVNKLIDRMISERPLSSEDDESLCSLDYSD